MTKRIPIAELGKSARAVRAAAEQPVLITEEGRPAAWVVSASRLAEVAAARGADAGAMYEQALTLLAVELYRDAVLTLSQGATLAGMSLHDFIDLCSRLGVSILHEPPEGIHADLEAAERIAGIKHSNA